MAKELNEDTGFNVSIKTLIGIGAAMATVIGMWFVLQADINEAKNLPANEVVLKIPAILSPPHGLCPPGRAFLA